MEKPAQHRQFEQAGLSWHPAFLLQHSKESFRISSAWPTAHSAEAMSISHFQAPCILFSASTRVCTDPPVLAVFPTEIASGCSEQEVAQDTTWLPLSQM